MNLEWYDWRRQLRHRLRSVEEISRFIELTPDETEALSAEGGTVPVAITPYYLRLIASLGPGHPLRKTMIPSTREFILSPGEAVDPLHEETDSPVPGLVHRYPDRALLLLTDSCAAYCRYCTRSRRVGDSAATTGTGSTTGDGITTGTGEACPVGAACDGGPAGGARWRGAVEYIRETAAIRDVIISGGDPLTLPDDALEEVLAALRQIPHVEIIRIGTKVPAVLPMRITPNLVRMLRRYHPLYISIHATHPDELTPEMERACTRLADGGIPLGSQTVLLRGVNDDVATIRALMQGLLRIRVRPYYLYQCDPIPGSAHFRTSVEKGLEIIAGLRGFTSGYAIPTYVIDAPGGGGKIPLMPDPVVPGGAPGELRLRNYAGSI
ncbi:MAG: KamA family radical SAM protein, partial [Alkalispirochaeta sp.]